MNRTKQAKTDLNKKEQFFTSNKFNLVLRKQLLNVCVERVPLWKRDLDAFETLGSVVLPRNVKESVTKKL